MDRYGTDLPVQPEDTPIPQLLQATVNASSPPGSALDSLIRHRLNDLGVPGVSEHG